MQSRPKRLLLQAAEGNTAQIGWLKLKYQSGIWRPILEGDTVLLPVGMPAQKILAFREGRMFLYADQECSFIGGGSNVAGGPFLFSVGSDAKDLLQRRGGNALYEALVPPTMRRWQSRCGEEVKSWGELYVLRIPAVWWDIECYAYLLEGEGADDAQLDPISVRGHLVLGTNHRLTGTYLELGGHDWQGYDPHYLAEGVIRTPGYGHLKLEGINIVMLPQFWYDWSKEKEK